MVSGRSGDWRTWVRRREKAGPRVRPAALVRRLQVAAMALLLLFVVVKVFGSVGPVQEVGNFDSWPFWLEMVQPAASPGVEPAPDPQGKVVVLGLVNRPSAEGAWVTVDGRRVTAFDEWKVSVAVRGGDTLGLVLEDGSPPVRVRVVAAVGIQSPRLGREWSVVAGEEVIGSVLLSDR